MKNVSYNAAILRGLRSDIISTLDDGGYVLARKYSLSAVNQVNPTFILVLLSKSPTSQSINHQVSEIKNALGKKFNENYSMTVLNPEQRSYRIDVTAEYKLRAGITEEEDGEIIPEETNEPTIPEEEDIGTSKAGRKKGQLSLLQVTIEGLFDTHTSLRKGDQAIGYVVLPRTGGDKCVTFSFKSWIAFEQALVCLEPGYYKSIQIVSKSMPFRFSIYPQEILPEVDVIKQEEVSSFLTNLKKAVNTIGPRPKVLSSFIELSSQKGVSKKIQIQFMEPGDAAYVAQYLGEHFDVKKEGAIMTVEVKNSQITEFSTAEITFSKKPEKRGLMAIARDVESVMGYVRMSRNYDEFHYLKFNRHTSNSHVVNLVESIKMFGYLQFIIVIETDIIDGIMKKWIVDGQHRFKGCKSEGMPILYTTVKGITSKYELVRLIAKLNSTSKSWNIGNYVDAWESINIGEYKNLKERYKKTGLPYTFLISIYEGMNRKDATLKFMDGKFQHSNPNAEKQISWIIDVQKTYLPKNRDLCNGVYEVIKKLADKYDQEKMMNGLAKVGKNNLPFLAGETLEEITNKFLRIYSAA
jgi:hypothetical protein